jgi:PAS domain S-box-containing protein
LDVSLFHHKSIAGIVNADSLKGFAVGVKDGDACIDDMQSHGVESLRKYNSYAALVAAAGQAEVRVFCMDEPPAIYLLNRQGLENDFYHSQPIDTGEFHRAVRKGNLALLKTIEAGFAQITPAQYKQIDDTWRGTSITSQFSSSSFKYAVYVSLLILLVAVFLMVWNFALRRSVQAKTAALTQSLESLRQVKKVSDDALEQLRTTLLAIPDLLFEVDLAGRYYSVDSPQADWLLLSPQDASGQHLSNLLPAQAVDVIMRALREADAQGHSNGQQYSLDASRGTLWFELSVAKKSVQPGVDPRFIALARNITVRKQHEHHLAQLLLEQRAMLENDMVGFVRLRERFVVWANPAFAKMTGYSAHEITGASTRQYYPSDEAYLSLGAAAYPIMIAGGVYRAQTEFVHKSGSSLWIDLNGALLDPASGESLWIFLDITERRQADLALQASLKEKVALLNEVHHRVKNNLQVVTSLLRLEASRSVQADTKSVLQEMQGRIRSMALLHESLYRSGSFASVELSAYIRQLATQAFRAQVGLSGLIRLDLRLAPVKVSMDQATTCGLLVNELITNSLKHGFPQGGSGEVCITLSSDSSQHGDSASAVCSLSVGDTGVGLPAGWTPNEGKTLGMQLARDMALQLGGELLVESGQGVSFLVAFPVKK